VYLDNNATSCVDSSVIDIMTPFLGEQYGNASSIHSFGQKARAAVEEGRSKVASLLGARPRDIIFTSGGTEADNAALRGVVGALGSKGSHIVTSTIEHPAILKTCEQLEEEGLRVTYVDVDGSGRVDPARVASAICDETILVSIMHANNEVGTLQPVEELAAVAKEKSVLFHTDAVQTVGKIPVDVGQLGVDLLSLSSHKIHGPKGVGALYVKPGVALQPMFLGGSHERSRRAGTENVPGIVGLGEACRVSGEALEDFGTRVRELRDRLEESIREQILEIVVNGPSDDRMPHVTNISFRGLEGEALLIALDFKGVAVSTGAACSSGSLQASHVLRAMKLKPEITQGAIRFSLSRMNTAEDIDYVLDTLPSLVGRMREMATRL
jgi:cysteine desulfurase